MAESVEISLPKGLKHWINSIKTASCTLFNDLEDLRDGNCIRELVEHMFHCKISFQERTPAGLIQGSINTIGDYIGFSSFPREFQSPSAAFKLSQGEPAYTIAFIQFLHDLAIERAEGAKLTASEADLQNALNETRDDIDQQLHAHLSHVEHMSDPHQPHLNDYLEEVPLSYEEYMQLERDSLDGSGELNVMNSTDFRSKRLTQGLKTHKTGLKGTNKPSTIGVTRTRSPVSRFGTAPMGGRLHSAHSSGSSGTGVGAGVSGGDNNILFSGVQSAPTPLVTRRKTPLRNITNTTSTGITAKPKPTTAPANIKVHTSGLHMSTLHDPTYKPKASNLFAQTVVPVVESSSESSDSEDSIQPTYVFAEGTTRGRGSGTNGGGSIGRKFPHSRSVSPGGRRHIRNQLHSIQQSMHSTNANTSTVPSTHNAVFSTQFGVVNRSVSPNEARLSQFYPYQQPYNTDADIPYRNHSTSNTTHPTRTTHTDANKALNPQLKPSKLGEDPINTHQKRVVRAVFKRNETQPPVMANIDDVISTERKNTILMWIQRQLGIDIDIYINSTTSSAYNKTAGKNVVSPDSVAVIPHTHSSSGASGNVHAPVMRRDKYAPPTNTTNTTTTNHSNARYAFYPNPEAAHYAAGRTAYMHGTYSIATYLGRVTNSVPEYTANAAVQLNSVNSSASSASGASASGGVLQIPEGFVDQVGFSVPPRVATPHTPVGLLNDPWVNGTLLSEILACTSGENRAMIKQVESYDRFGKLLSVPKLIVAGTEHTVKSKAQAIHNVQLCMSYLSSHIPLFPTLDYSAEDIVSGEVSLWRLLDVVHEHCRGRGRNRGGGRGSAGGGSGRGGSRGRSVSPGAAGQRSRSPIRSISAPPESRQLNNNNNHTTTHGQGAHHTNPTSVHFADGSEHSRSHVPVPASPPRRGHYSSTGVVRTVDSGGVRSRSTSPSVHSTGGVDTSAASKLEQRRMEAESERLKAREYRQRMLHSNTSASGGSNTNSASSAASVDKERGWSSSTAVEKPRSGSARRGSVTSVSNTNTNTNSSNDAAIPTASTNSTTTTNSTHTTHKHSKHWLPPRLSAAEIEAARNTYLPNVTIFQMRAIRDWLNNAFSINLLDAECGFGYMGAMSGSNGNNLGISDGSGGADSAGAINNNTHTRTDARFDPKYTHPSTVTPPPLALHQDRLRNGVLLGLLLMRLEPVAAIHAHIPRLLHKNPRTIELCMENIERVLFVFKVRRSPPLPHHYLCLAEEILNGNDRVIWGLLWEIMQAYPYNALQTLHNMPVHTKPTTTNNPNTNSRTADSYTTHTNNGILYADADTLIPVPGNGPLKNPPGNSSKGNKPHPGGTPHNKTQHNTNTFGLKGDEARFNVPQYMRYNFNDSELEHPVPIHTLPYSDAQRHALDVSLLQWLDDTNILSSIIGALARPVTVLALESYCRDGTLLCTLATDVLGLTLTKPHIPHPTTYTECVNNIKLCTEVLRKCQNMRSRYLYSGVEEHICGGRWDSILGLLEDMHRYADNVHIHANTYSTVDVYGRVAGSSGSGFELNTVETPYLGKHAQSSGAGGASGVGAGGESSGSGATSGSRSMSAAQGADLLHDVPYRFEPQLHIHHTPPSNTTSNATYPVSLDNDQFNPLGSPLNRNKPTSAVGKDEFVPSVRTGDLFPSNPISGQNVVNMLKQHTTSATTNVNPNTTSTTNTTNTTSNINTHRVHASHIPTPTRRASPIRGTALPTWVVQDTPPHTTQTRDRDSGDVLAQMLDIDSDTDAHESRSPRRINNRVSSGRGSSSSSSGGTSSGRTNTPVHLRSALKTTSRASSVSPTRTPTHTTHTKHTTHTTPNVRTRVHTPHTNNANTSTYSRDSLDYPSSLESSPDADTNNMSNIQANLATTGLLTSNTVSNSTTNTLSSVRGNNAPERAHITKLEKQKLYKWLNSIGVPVPMRSERTFLSNDIFSDGVYLCMIIQKLERCGTIPGTFANPRTQSERVQNIRRVLELLATRHKNIPLRALSCEEDVLQGDLNRTIELLLCIKKAYKNSRL